MLLHTLSTTLPQPSLRICPCVTALTGTALTCFRVQDAPGYPQRQQQGHEEESSLQQQLQQAQHTALPPGHHSWQLVDSSSARVGNSSSSSQVGSSFWHYRAEPGQQDQQRLTPGHQIQQTLPHWPHSGTNKYSNSSSHAGSQMMRHLSQTSVRAPLHTCSLPQAACSPVS